jgi:TRAP-type C4-dicarboxylate transport system permease small subunit
MSGAASPPSGAHRIMVPLLALSDAVAAILLAADLLVVCASVLLRFLFNAPVEWADDVARGLMVGSSFFGAASALARSENLAWRSSSTCSRPASGAWWIPWARCS